MQLFETQLNIDYVGQNTLHPPEPFSGPIPLLTAVKKHHLPSARGALNLYLYPFHMVDVNNSDDTAGRYNGSALGLSEWQVLVDQLMCNKMKLI
ncbi:hypothetical protein RSOL_063740, partial [Rhizoctonia solani AG-3 Rhs1AP]